MKKNIALVTGGFSGESVISYKSAETILKNVDTEKWNCFYIDISPEGWFCKHEGDAVLPVDKNDFSVLRDGAKIRFDAALIGMHGTPAEDGKFLGYLDMLGIPYTTCSAATSALTFNKHFTVSVAAFSGINVARSAVLFKGDAYNLTEILEKVNLPVFVKPNNGGSSIGMSRVDEVAELEAAIKKAFQEDNQVLIEEFIAGREFTIGVYQSKGEVIALPLTEVSSQNRFFDFEAKYQGKSEETTPAVVDEAIAAKIRATAKKIYHVFNCSGVIRIDFIYNEERGNLLC